VNVRHDCRQRQNAPCSTQSSAASALAPPGKPQYPHRSAKTLPHQGHQHQLRDKEIGDYATPPHTRAEIRVFYLVSQEWGFPETAGVAGRCGWQRTVRGSVTVLPPEPPKAPAKNGNRFGAAFARGFPKQPAALAWPAWDALFPRALRP